METERRRGSAALAVVAAALLGACSKSPPAESVDSLVKNPERIKEIMQKCRLDRAAVGEQTCRAAAEAARIRFMGDGKAKYTPGGAVAGGEPKEPPSGKPDR